MTVVVFLALLYDGIQDGIQISIVTLLYLWTWTGNNTPFAAWYDAMKSPM